MIAGNKNKFAIQIEIIDKADDWIFGYFLFWIYGKAVGNPLDKSVDLKSCLNWLKQFVASSVNRFEPELFDMDKGKAYLHICGSVVLQDQQDAFFSEEKYDSAFERFHIAQLGMSSFDDLNIMLIEHEDGRQRIIWQENGDPIEEAHFGAREIHNTCKEVVKILEREIVSADI